MEAEIRKKRQEEIYARQELIRKIWEYIGWFVLFCTIIGIYNILACIYKEKTEGEYGWWKKITR